jgi:aspartyl-tRNA(Asn)/glutamyl-tRNA(Gln) amidotransferase subunit B
VLEGGESVIQETRGWDENKGKTFSQRKKESANDYRYFPDPDLPKLSVGLSDEFSLASLAENLPVLPAKRREIYSNLGISREQIEIIISNLGLTNFFDSVVSEAKNDSKFAQRAANYLTTDVAALLTEESSIDKASLTGFSSLIELLIEGKISSRVAKDLLPEVVFGDRSAAELINERGLEQSDSKDTLTVVVENIIAGNESIVREYREGKESALQYLVGQGMKATKGAANPIMLREVLIETIGKLQ